MAHEAERWQMDPDFLDTDFILQFPEPGTVVPYRNISLITEDIPLQLLYSAYMQGVFPWFNEDEGEPVLWYSPEPRFCLRMEQLHIPRRLERFLRHSPYTYTMDNCFSRVINECASMNREGQQGTWIGKKIIRAYTAFHEKGFAHSIEAWKDGELAGGFYGVLIGSVFFGESMFTKQSESSKSAFALFARTFMECGGRLIDSQSYTQNIARYGASNISRTAFLRLERKYLPLPLTADLRKTFEKNAASLCTEST